MRLNVFAYLALILAAAVAETQKAMIWPLLAPCRCQLYAAGLVGGKLPVQKIAIPASGRLQPTSAVVFWLRVTLDRTALIFAALFFKVAMWPSLFC